ncbi:MAG TPA: TadE/TadG family type IV pilus assembly protein [Parvularculaceae bacterium]|nr:TadE/TadG family type IV pilus assembly protein [Parvularculaceae bacterium]
MNHTSKNAWKKRERGAVTIEFVVTLPLFVTALAFAFEFGELFLAHQSTVNNVRAATRYLQRSDLSADDIAKAENMIRTGRLTGGSAPEYLTSANADITINTNYGTFGPPNFTRAGKTMQIVVSASFPLKIFGFVDNGTRAAIPFAVVEDLRYVGF